MRHYNGPADSFDIPTDMEVDGSGNVWVTGFNDQTIRNSPLPSFGVATVKYDTDGNRSWVRNYLDEPGVFTMAGSSALDKDGNLFITAFNYNNGANKTHYSDYYDDPGSPELIILKYDANGKKVWLRRNQKAWASADWGGSFITRTDSKGSVIITGDCLDEKSWDSNVTTMKYSASGKRKWTKVEHTWSNNLAMIIDKKDSVLITGLEDEYEYKYFTVKYAP